MYVEGGLPTQCPRNTFWFSVASQQGKVASLHAESFVHQDFKPANFIEDDSAFVVSRNWIGRPPCFGHVSATPFQPPLPLKILRRLHRILLS